jgi:ABC-type multidrug transport system permease subunit
MDENPYKSPAQDFMAELRIKRRRRTLINFALTVGLFIALFVAYWGIKVLVGALNDWLFAP